MNMTLSRRTLMIGGLSLGALTFATVARASAKGNFPYKLTEAQWRKRLSPSGGDRASLHQSARKGKAQRHIFLRGLCATAVFLDDKI
jgi:hypothetical protein